MNHSNQEDISKAIYESLIELKKRKEKTKRPAEYKLFLFWMFVISSLVMLLDLFMRFYLVSSSDPMMYLFHYIFAKYGLFPLSVVITLFIAYKYYETEEEKYKKKYESLRSEVIKLARDSWPKYKSLQSIQMICEELKTEHDINIYYES